MAKIYDALTGCDRSLMNLLAELRIEKTNKTTGETHTDRDCIKHERASAVRFLRHWASLSSAFEDVEGRDLLAQFANRLEDGEHLLPHGVTTVRDRSRDMPTGVGLAGCGHVERPGVCGECARNTAEGCR